MASLLDLIHFLFQKRWIGVYRAMVVSNQDSSGLGRVRLILPAPYGGNGKPGETWAQIATLMAGNNRGTWFIPDPGDEVLVAFEEGDPRHPYVVGTLWSAGNPPPEQMDGAGQNPVKSIHSRNGITVSLYDLNGDETLALKTPGGQSLTLRDGDGGSLEMQDASGNQIRLSAAGIQVLSSAKVTVNASQVELSAGSVTVNSGMSIFSGVIKADTVITNSVISASYTPGAGNVM